MSQRNIEKEFNLMADALSELDVMFAELDTYRKTKDKRSLFKVHSYELKARRLMKQLEKLQNTESKTESSAAA